MDDRCRSDAVRQRRPAPCARASRAARHRGEHRDLVGGADRLVIGRRLPVAPHLRRRQHPDEQLTVAHPGCGEHLADGGAVELLTTGAGRLSRCGEEQEHGHPRRRPNPEPGGRRRPFPSRDARPQGNQRRDPDDPAAGLLTLEPARSCSSSRPTRGDGSPGTVRLVTRILLARHGQSVWNASGRWQGWADPPLTELGRQQAWAAAAAIGTVDAIVASDLERALTTAMVISEAIGVGPVVVEPDLKERDVGEWTGCTRAEIADRWPDAFAALLASGTEAGGDPVTPPGGEEPDAVLERVARGLERIVDLVGPTAEVLAISHGGVIRALERSLGRVPEPIANLGALRVEVDGDGRVRLGERVLLIDPDEVAVTVPRQS